MAYKRSGKTISAVICAYNEGPRIGQVLDVICSYPNFREIIVVDDGSTDNTSAVISRYKNVTLIKNSKNIGKGASMDIGVQATTAETIFFSDADIIGLTNKLIDEIVTPVTQKKVDTSFVILDYWVYKWKFFVRYLKPLLGGERAVSRNLWNNLPNFYKHQYRVEAGLNLYAIKYGRGCHYRIAPEISQTIKEKKYGLWLGAKKRLIMMINFLTSHIKFRIDFIKKQIEKSFAPPNY